jgi:hypothetical protein
MRARLCIHPVCHRARMPASTRGMPVRPCCQASRTAGPDRPRGGHRSGRPAGGGGVGKVVEQVMGELPPADLPKETRPRTRGRSRCPPVQGHAAGGDHLAWSDLPEMQVRRQSRTAVPVGTVAHGLVIRHGLVHEGPQTGQRAGLARLPVRSPKDASQPMRGRSARSSGSRPRGRLAGAGIRAGAGVTSVGQAQARQAFQKGVNTRYGSPARLITARVRGAGRR